MNKKIIWLGTLLFVVLTAIVSTCEWTEHAYCYTYMGDFCYVDNCPTIGTAYRPCNELVIFQVVRGGALVQIKHECRRKTNAGLSLGYSSIESVRTDDKLLFVETSYPYADGETLKGEYYEFVGNYTYETKCGSSNTVRKFREHKCKPFRF